MSFRSSPTIPDVCWRSYDADTDDNIESLPRFRMRFATDSLCVKRLMIIMISWMIWTKSLEIGHSIDQNTDGADVLLVCFCSKRKITD